RLRARLPARGLPQPPVTRRILLVLLAFTAVVIAGAMIPLALYATSHDQTSFTQATAGVARTDAAVAQSRLDEIYISSQSGGVNPAADAPLLLVLNEVEQAGDRLLIVTADKNIRPQEGAMPVGNWGQLARQANAQARLAMQAHQTVQPVTETTGSWVVAVIPVREHGAGPVEGTVILARSTAPLHHDILELWVSLGTIAFLALLAAALLAFALARWVSRPLAGLDSAAGRLADGNLASRAVIADVSHQLRTPLAALRLRLDLLAADTDPATGHELAGALEELARLSRLVDGLLAGAGARNVVPVPVAVDLAEVARERVVAWHPVADDRGIRLEAISRPSEAGWGSALTGGRLTGGASDPGGQAMAWIGEGHLEQILDNLIANALEALSAGHQVIVTTTVTASGGQVTVSDNGPGMNAEDRGRAFLRFSTSNPNGTGLGLAIVHRLVTSNGGTARPRRRAAD